MWLLLGSIKRPQNPLQHHLPNKHVVNLLKFHHRRPRGLNKNLEVVPHHILWNNRKRRNIGDVVGLITRGIVLIHLGLPSTIPTLTNLVFITRFMVMTSTIALHCILNFNKLSPRRIMRGNPKNLARSRKGKVKPKVDQPPNQFLTNPTPWKHDLHV